MRTIKINDSEDKKETIIASSQCISSNHELRVSLYECGVSYGRMVESRQNALMWVTFGFLVLGDVAVYAFNWPKWLTPALTVLWVFALIGFNQFTQKTIEKHLAEEIKSLERLRDNELKITEGK